MPSTKWSLLATKKLASLLKKAQASPTLSRRVPQPAKWQAEVQLVGSVAMARLNARFRGKRYATDVLSFETAPIFRKSVNPGFLGEIVICLPVLKRQAREMGHSPEAELAILLVHGILHLLGMDHEKGPSAAREMARWEARLLQGQVRSSRSLIARVHSGK